MEIILSKTETTKIGNEIIEYSDDLEAEIKEFLSIIDSINTAWDGADALKYINTLKQKYVVNLEELQGLVKEYGQYLSNVSGAYTTLDESFTSKSIDV